MNKINENNIIYLDDYIKEQSHSRSLWQKTILNSLSDIDYPEDVHIPSSALEQAKELIDLLPIEIQEPSIGIEPDGELLLEWYKKEKSGKSTIYSIIFNGKAIVFSLLKEGKRTKNYGCLNFCTDNAQKVILDIKKNFENVIQQKRTAIR